MSASLGTRVTYPLQLLEDARVQVLGLFPILEGVLSSLLRRRHRCIELAQLVGESHADFERVRHLAASSWRCGGVRCRICCWQFRFCASRRRGDVLVLRAAGF